MQAAAMMDQGLQTQVEGLLHTSPSPAFYVRLNPSRLLGVVGLFLGAVGQTPRAPNEPVSPLLTRCERLAQLLPAAALLCFTQTTVVFVGLALARSSSSGLGLQSKAAIVWYIVCWTVKHEQMHLPS